MIKCKKVPEMFLFSKSGKFVHKFVGKVSKEELEKYLKLQLRINFLNFASIINFLNPQNYLQKKSAFVKSCLEVNSFYNDTINICTFSTL